MRRPLTLLFWLLCIVIGALLGSALRLPAGQCVAALFGLLVVVVMVLCTFAPLFIDLTPYKDPRQQ